MTKKIDGLIKADIDFTKVNEREGTENINTIDFLNDNDVFITINTLVNDKYYTSKFQLTHMLINNPYQLHRDIFNRTIKLFNMSEDNKEVLTKREIEMTIKKVETQLKQYFCADPHTPIEPIIKELLFAFNIKQ